MLSFLKGDTPLHAAVMKGDHDSVKTLLQSKADVIARNSSVSSSVFFSCLCILLNLDLSYFISPLDFLLLCYVDWII